MSCCPYSYTVIDTDSQREMMIRRQRFTDLDDIQSEIIFRRIYGLRYTNAYLQTEIYSGPTQCSSVELTSGVLFPRYSRPLFIWKMSSCCLFLHSELCCPHILRFLMSDCRFEGLDSISFIYTAQYLKSQFASGALQSV